MKKNICLSIVFVLIVSMFAFVGCSGGNEK